MLQWSTLQTFSKLRCCVACCTTVWLHSFLCWSKCDIQQLPGYAAKPCLSTVTGTAACCVLPARQCSTTLEIHCMCIPYWTFPKLMDWPCYFHLLASQITGYHTLWFSLWEYVKCSVCQTLAAHINDMKEKNSSCYCNSWCLHATACNNHPPGILWNRIQVAIATVDTDMHLTWMEPEYRLDTVQMANGAHVECV
jgi:hypothetical protein